MALGIAGAVTPDARHRPQASVGEMDKLGGVIGGAEIEIVAFGVERAKALPGEVGVTDHAAFFRGPPIEKSAARLNVSPVTNRWV